MVDMKGVKLYFTDTLDAENEESAQEKGLAEYMKQYPNDIIAVAAEEIEQVH